jgi:hypothetical protein
VVLFPPSRSEVLDGTLVVDASPASDEQVSEAFSHSMVQNRHLNRVAYILG